MSKELQIRNSTVDFLVFTRDAGEDGIEVRVQNGDVWLTQKAISQLFDVRRAGHATGGQTHIAGTPRTRSPRRVRP